MIVVDAGAVLEALLGTAAGHRAAAILSDEEVTAPDPVDVEVFHGLVRSYRADRLDACELDERVQLLLGLDIMRRTGDDAASEYATSDVVDRSSSAGLVN